MLSGMNKVADMDLLRI